MLVGENEFDLKKNILWNTFGNIVYLFSQWLFTVVIVRLTSYESVGIYSLAVSITNVLYSIALYGLRNYQVSDVINEYSDKEYIISRYITSAISMIVCLGAVLISNYESNQKMAIILYMIFHIEEAYIDVLHGVIQKRNRMDYVGISCIIRGCFNLLLFTITLYFSKDILLAIGALIISTGIAILIYDERKIKKISNFISTYRWDCVLQILKKGLPLAVCTVLIAATPVVPRYYLEELCGQEALGIYATIATPAVLIQAMSTFIFMPVIPILSHVYVEGKIEKFKNQLIRIFYFFILLCCLVIVSAKIFGRFGLYVLFGDKILSYDYLLISVLICTMETAFALLINAILTIMRGNIQILIVNVAGMISSLIVSKKLVSYYDLIGTSYAHIVALGIQILVGMIFVYKTIVDARRIK